MSQVDHDAINAALHYTQYGVFQRTSAVSPDQVAETLAQIEQAAGDRGLVVRGWYDLAGFRADADVLVWWSAPDSTEVLQDAYLALRRSPLGQTLEPVWSQIGLHRPAEFNKTHVPAFLMGDDPRAYICVYPFVRSYEWYLLPEQERREMLREHGALARDYADVRANTVSAFALGDYEWLLAFEGDELHRIVDLMRELRAAKARRHTREELPFFTGRRRPLADIVATWGEPTPGCGCC